MKKGWFLGFLFMVSSMSGQFSHVQQGDSLYASGDYAAAINSYAKSSKERSQLQIARAYNAMANTEKALLQYESIVAAEADQIIARFELGKLYFKSKSFEKARLAFEELTDAVPDNPEFHFYLAKSLQELQEFDAGVLAYERAIQSDSTHLRSIFSLSKHYMFKQENGNALEYVEQGLNTAPNDAAFINLKALILHEKGLHQAAIVWFERLLELNRAEDYVFKKLGQSYLNQWEFDKSKWAFRQLEGFPDGEADAFYGLGEVYHKEQQLDSALFFFQKSIEARRYVFDKEYASIGRIYRERKQTKQALDNYTLAWEENKANYYYYYQVCVLADEYFKDPKTKLGYYERLFALYENVPGFLEESARKRISELKEEIHFTAD